MTEIHDPLILDLIAWVAERPRPYAEVLDAWRTSCPRLPVWEDALDRGLVARRFQPGRGAMIEATTAGLSLLHASGRSTAKAPLSRRPRPAC